MTLAVAEALNPNKPKPIPIQVYRGLLFATDIVDLPLTNPPFGMITCTGSK